MAKYKFTKDFEQKFVNVCLTTPSMAQAAVSLQMNYKTVRFHAKRLGCFKKNQAGKNTEKRSGLLVTPLEEIFNGTHITYQSHKLKRRLLKERLKSHQCENCCLEEWQGLPIPLELHHVDGNRYNNSFQNLRLLYLNCHALTANYRARNIKKI